MKKIFIVIPAYNEEKAIVKVIHELTHACYHNIVVVDDCSKDKTYSLVSKLNIHLLKHIVNRGQGAALRTGITFALQQGADVIVTFDSDGQHRVSEIKQVIAPVMKGKVDVTLGSRFLKHDKRIPFFRRLVLKTGIFVQWVMYGIWLSDCHNGFRALSRKAAQKIDIHSDRMEHASEIVEEIKRKKLRYKEVPVTIDYTDYSKARGQSSWNSLRIAFRMLIKKLM